MKRLHQSTEFLAYNTDCTDHVDGVFPAYVRCVRDGLLLYAAPVRWCTAPVRWCTAPMLRRSVPVRRCRVPVSRSHVPYHTLLKYFEVRWCTYTVPMRWCTAVPVRRCHVPVRWRAVRCTNTMVTTTTSRHCSPRLSPCRRSVKCVFF